MIIKILTLISFILTIILIVILVTVVILNKKLARANKISVLVTRQLESSLNESVEIKYSPECEKKQFMKTPSFKNINNQSVDCSIIQKQIEIESECSYMSESKLSQNLNIDPDFLSRVTSIIYSEITNTDNLIDVISSELCISTSQLNRRIKLMTGMTTTGFILKTRLNRAKKQLIVTQKPIGEVAMDCGFNDFAYFSRSFKKEFDMTPTTFQRMSYSVN